MADETSGLGRFSPFVNMTVVVVFLALFWRSSDNQTVLFRDQLKEAHDAKLAAEERHDKQLERQYKLYRDLTAKMDDLQQAILANQRAIIKKEELK